MVVVIKNESAVQGWERVRTHYRPKTPMPHNQQEKEEIVGDEK